MPTDAELRFLFRDSAAPEASIDAAAVIRRTRRRRLPQQLGVGSVLTLAVAGIGFASFTGLQGLTPAMTAADAPVSVSESGPFSGAEQSTRDSCAVDTSAYSEVDTDLEVTGDFGTGFSAGHLASGSLTLTNTGSQPVAGVVVDAVVTVTRSGTELRQSGISAAGVSVSLAPGESMNFAVNFDAAGCAATGDTASTPLEPGQYDVSVTLAVESPDGTVRQVGGPASAITVR